MSGVVIASGSKSRITACRAASRGVMAPSSSPSTTAPRLPKMISPGAIQSAPKLTNAPIVRSRPDDALDDQFVQPVLQRQHKAVLRQMRGERAGCRLGVLRLHRQEDALPGAGEFIRREGRRGDGEFLDRAGDAQAGAADRRDMLGHHVDERDVVAGALQPRADRAADRAGAPDQDPFAHHQSSSIARVSCTATFQISSISASSR